MRTEKEVIRASKFVEVMSGMALAGLAGDQVSPEEMRIIRISSNRLLEILDWVLGGDNQFGEMVERAAILDEDEAGDFSHRPRTKPRRRPKASRQ